MLYSACVLHKANSFHVNGFYKHSKQKIVLLFGFDGLNIYSILPFNTSLLIKFKVSEFTWRWFLYIDRVENNRSSKAKQEPSLSSES